jgi:purine nucleosidase
MFVDESKDWPISLVTPRVRVISDNDYSGDPDGLVQLAHHLLSRSVELCGVIGSHLHAGDPFDSSVATADSAATEALHLVRMCGRGDDVRVIAGSNSAMSSATEPMRSEAAKFLVHEAMRDDSDLPLFVVCGAGLTTIASAWLIEPKIADRLTVVWIGGHEHSELADPAPGAPQMEYNLQIDPIAAQVVFNDSNLHVWQVPRDAYRSVIVSRAELLQRMRSVGELGTYLFHKLAAVVEKVIMHGRAMGETYVFGDSPLVMLTALTTAYEPGPASSYYVDMPCPNITVSGLYEQRSDGRPLRVFTRLDNRLLLEDLFAKLALFAAGES